MKQLFTIFASTLASFVAEAADFTVTTKTAPATVYLFAIVPAVQSPGQLPYIDIYVTDDKATCEAQAADWSKLLAPSKAVCLPHKQKVLKIVGGSGDSE
jgi:hypothetical protein